MGVETLETEELSGFPLKTHSGTGIQYLVRKGEEGRGGKVLLQHEVIKGRGRCVNAGSTIPYEAGTISIMQAGVPHEVTADSEGLYLFAKFMPALC